MHLLFRRRRSWNRHASLSGKLVRKIDIQIERWPVDRLILSNVNPRTHSTEQVAQIAASIREFGFVNPILVGADGGIIAGEGRLRAALIGQSRKAYFQQISTPYSLHRI